MVAHSNVYYIYTKAGFQAVEKAKAYKNDYGLDLFLHDKKIYEGRSGVIVCNESDNCELSKKIDSLGGIDKTVEIIIEFIQKYGESPRYTRPDEQKKLIFTPKAKDENIVYAMEASDRKKHYYRRYQMDDDYVFYSLNNETHEHRTVYVACEGYMLALGSHSRLDEHKMFLAGLEGGLKAEVERRFNESLTNSQKYTDYAYANILNRLDEAKKHNEPIMEARRLENERMDAEREGKRAAEERKEKEKYDQAIKNAEVSILERQEMMNVKIDGKSLVMQLFRKYEITIPLKTQGWIIDALRSIFYDEQENEWTYQYYDTSRDSTVFDKYLLELVDAVKTKHAKEEADAI